MFVVATEYVGDTRDVRGVQRVRGNVMELSGDSNGGKESVVTLGEEPPSEGFLAVLGEIIQGDGDRGGQSHPGRRCGCMGATESLGKQVLLEIVNRTAGGEADFRESGWFLGGGARGRESGRRRGLGGKARGGGGDVATRWLQGQDTWESECSVVPSQ